MVSANVTTNNLEKEIEMPKKIASWGFAALGLGLSLAIGANLVGPATASNDEDKLGTATGPVVGEVSGVKSGSSLSMAEIVAKLNEQGFAEIYEIEREGGALEVKARNAEGALMELYIDPRTGRLLKSEYED